MTKLYDPVRRTWVAANPEEIVRQNLIRQMIGPLGYPKGLLSVEKELSSFSHSAPARRVDLLCYSKDQGGLKPLLLIECKAGSFFHGAENQLFGYNVWIGAPFVCLACEVEVKTMWLEKGGIQSVPFLPPYAQLTASLCAL